MLAPPDLALVQRRIRDVVRTLEDFGRLREAGRSRGEYMEQVGGVGVCGGGGVWWGCLCVRVCLHVCELPA